MPGVAFGCVPFLFVSALRVGAALANADSPPGSGKRNNSRLKGKSKRRLAGETGARPCRKRPPTAFYPRRSRVCGRRIMRATSDVRRPIEAWSDARASVIRGVQ